MTLVPGARVQVLSAHAPNEEYLDNEKPEWIKVCPPCTASAPERCGSLLRASLLHAAVLCMPLTDRTCTSGPKALHLLHQGIVW